MTTLRQEAPVTVRQVGAAQRAGDGKGHRRAASVAERPPVAVLALSHVVHGDLAPLAQGAQVRVAAPDVADGGFADAAHHHGRQHVARGDGPVVVDRDLVEHATAGGQATHERGARATREAGGFHGVKHAPADKRAGQGGHAAWVALIETGQGQHGGAFQLGRKPDAVGVAAGTHLDGIVGAEAAQPDVIQ